MDLVTGVESSYDRAQKAMRKAKAKVSGRKIRRGEKKSALDKMMDRMKSRGVH